MKHFWSLLLISSALFAEDAKTEESADKAKNKNVETLASDNASFGWDLYDQIRGKEGNLCVSPYSIASALVLPYMGAEGETKEQMSNTLQFLQESPQLEEAFGAFNAYLTKHPTNYPQSFRLLIANSLWIQERMRLLGKYLSQVRRDFRASVQRVDFVNQTEVSRGQINRWVAHQTNNKIIDLIGKGVLDYTTRMVVVSALYLKAKWMHPFPKNQTHLVPFFPHAKKTITIPMMHETNNFPFLEEREALVLEIPLEQPAPEAPELVMDLVLPKARDGLTNLESELSMSTLKSWFEKLQNENVSVTIPKFTIRHSLGLADTLQKMGMVVPFSSKADFSGITGSKDLMISDVVHQAYIDVSEGGVEAAAATAAVMSLTAMPDFSRPKEFKADHPFLFFLRDRKTGAILFMGRLVDPLAL